MKRIVILIVFTLSFMSCSSFKNNKDQTIGTTEAIGVIEQNFNNLDVNNNASLSLTEFSAFLSYLQ